MYFDHIHLPLLTLTPPRSTIFLSLWDRISLWCLGWSSAPKLEWFPHLLSSQEYSSYQDAGIFEDFHFFLWPCHVQISNIRAVLPVLQATSQSCAQESTEAGHGAVSALTCLCTLVSCSRLFSRKEIFCFWAALPPPSSLSSSTLCIQDDSKYHDPLPSPLPSHQPSVQEKENPQLH